MNRPAFFAALRSKNSGIFGTSLSQRQVDGIAAILTAGSHLPLPHLAHVLGEVYHETGGGMYPIKETVFRNHKNQNPTDAEVIARLDRAFAKGKLPWVKEPYWRGGAFGRGQIQVTHDANYRKFGITNYADALKLPVSAKIAVKGCERGLFTGRKLADFDTANGYDHVQARRIVNGFVAKQAADVAKAARAFEAALTKAEYTATAAHSAPPAPKSPSGAQSPTKTIGGALAGATAAGGAAAAYPDYAAQIIGAALFLAVVVLMVKLIKRKSK